MILKTKYSKGRLSFKEYQNGRVAILIGDSVASVNLPDHPMTEDEVAIKDYSEGEGNLRTLMDAGIVSSPLRWVRSGWVEIPVCRLLRRK